MLYRDSPTVEVSTKIAATPEAVWALVSDIATPARFSPELQSVEWAPGSTELAVGSRFRGINENPHLGRWTTDCEVVEVDEGRRYAWRVINDGETMATWCFEIDPASSGVILRQWGRMGPAPSGLAGAIAAMPEKEGRIIAGRLEEWRAGMQANLDGIRELLEGPAPTEPS